MSCSLCLLVARVHVDVIQCTVACACKCESCTLMRIGVESTGFAPLNTKGQEGDAMRHIVTE